MSARRTSSKLLVFSIIALAAGLMLWLTPSPVAAQGSGVPESTDCSQPPESSCSTCHAQVHPVVDQGEWHVVHARKDICRNCHGGDDRTLDKDQAHVGMLANPLNDTYLSCHQCHPDDYRQRAEQFAIILGVKPQSSEPVTATVVVNPSRGMPVVRLPAAPTSGSGVAGTAWLLALIAVVAILLTGVTLTWRKLSH